MAKINIADATATQLAEFASVDLGIPDLNPRIGKDTILARMSQAGYSDTTIEVEAAPLAKAPAGGAPASGEKMTILIAVQDGPGGSEPVPVGVNGQIMVIPRGKPVDVPKAYVHALSNANRAHWETNSNGELTTMRFVPTHPFSILKAA